VSVLNATHAWLTVIDYDGCWAYTPSFGALLAIARTLIEKGSK
jgi:hypothetical protein